LHFTVKETYGEKPISEWLAHKVKSFVLEKYGVDAAVSITPISSGSKLADSPKMAACEGGTALCSRRKKSSAPYMPA
jgi:hypothetical protein